MQRRSAGAELAHGALGAAIIVALAVAFVAFQPLRAKGALGSADIVCLTYSEVTAEARAVDPHAAVLTIVGDDAVTFVVAITHQSPRPAPIDLVALTKLVGIYIQSDPRAKKPVMVQFFDAGGCRLWGVEGDFEALQAVRREIDP